MQKKVLSALCIIVMMIGICQREVEVKAETYEYDELNRVVKVTYDDGSYITYEYDRNGNITSIKVYEAVTVEPEEVTTKKEEETTKKEQETTKKPQETTKKPQETTKKTQQKSNKTGAGNNITTK